ncbi:hypothetical protein [Sandaracinus amylolyticus]|uniref:hypothetical protein n=1 Tax=Sandaracinus amylolyticus TaxID=927083 RepID=UPI001F21D147|nr:hypothetical protein [Sandaracinus amylolyticus]UJR79592.1 Hypothetical protein I5071_16280 [Sandaracinus amylolyticus]
MFGRPLLALLLVMGSTTSVAAQDLRLIARGPQDPEWTTGPVQARVGDEVEVRVALLDRDGTLRADVPRVRWDGRVRRAQGSLPGARQIRFVRIEPRLEHVERVPPNPGIAAFSNAVLTGPRHGEWLGYDVLEYEQHAITGEPGVRIEPGRVVVTAVHPSDRPRDVHGGAGSMWLAAEIVLEGDIALRTPDARDVDRFGLSRAVMRISMREADDYVGWLSTYFHVPNVFGSSGPGRDHQTERYVGADCADVLVGARRAMGRTIPYVSVAGLSRVARPISASLLLRAEGVLVDDAGTPVRLAWGEHVARGDLLAIGYVHAGELPRAWDHIGALVRDDGDGSLDGDDVLRHMTHRGLADRTLRQEGEIRVRVWRFE